MSIYNFVKENYQSVISIDLTNYKDVLNNEKVVFYLEKKLIVIDKEKCPETFYSPALNIHGTTLDIELPIPFGIFPSTRILGYMFLNDITHEEYENHENNNIRMLSKFWLKMYKTAACFTYIKDYKLVYNLSNKFVNDYFCNTSSMKHSYYFMNTFIEKSHTNMIQQQMYDTIKEIKSDIAVYNNDIQININPVELKCISLYNYQKSDINFIKSVEKCIDNGENELTITYDSYTKFKIGETTYMRLNDEIFLYENNTNMYKQTDTIKYFGGVIHNEPGLGKTLSMLYYIFSDENERVGDIIYSDNCDYMYKRGKMGGEFCKSLKKNDSNFCKKHIESPFVDKINYTFRDENKIVDNTTNATLVVCPSHLCDQWIKEALSKFKNTKNIIMVTTYEQYKNLKLKDIYYADLIVTSYQFLINPNYKKSSFKLTDVLYKRIVYDEINELEHMHKNNVIYNLLMSFKSKYRWCITGTPFEGGCKSLLLLTAIIYNMPYNLNMEYFSDISLNILNTLTINSKMLYHRHTKDSIKHEIKKNIITTEYRPLEFTSQERAIYDSHLLHKNKYISKNILIKLCCHAELFNDLNELISNCKTLDEIQRVIHEKNKQDFEKTKLNIEKDTLELEYYGTLLGNDNTDEDTIENIKIIMTNLKKEITKNKKYIESLGKVVKYLDNVVKNINGDETCPICMDTVEEATITKCGHLFCWDCINELASIKIQRQDDVKCPTCNLFVNKDDIFKIKEDQEEQLVKYELNSIEHYVNETKSTKIGNIVHYLLNEISKNDKCIVFSQWDYLLDKVGNIINKYIKFVNCKGTIYQKKKAVSKFIGDSDTRIILLSSKNCASGLNLIEANKIIFIEPIYGTKEHRTGVEMQAISRADRITQNKDITVVKFYIKNTIEEELIEI